MKERIQLEIIQSTFNHQNRTLLGFSKKQSIETTKQSIVLVWQQVNQPK